MVLEAGMETMRTSKLNFSFTRLHTFLDSVWIWAGGERARQLSDVQRDRVWQRGSMITFLKEIIDDDFKRIVFEPTCMGMYVAVYIIVMCVIVCILCTLHMCIMCNAQLYRHILCGTAWLKAKLNPREYRKKTRVIECDSNQFNNFGILISRMMFVTYFAVTCKYWVCTNNTHILYDCHNIILLKFTSHKVNVRDQSAG